MRRLYLQIYLTVAASLVVFGALVSVLWMVVSERADNRDLLDGVGAIALEILPGPEQPLPALQDALEDIQARLPVVLAVDDASAQSLFHGRVGVGGVVVHQDVGPGRQDEGGQPAGVVVGGEIAHDHTDRWPGPAGRRPRQ